MHRVGGKRSVVCIPPHGQLHQSAGWCSGQQKQQDWQQQLERQMTATHCAPLPTPTPPPAHEERPLQDPAQLILSQPRFKLARQVGVSQQCMPVLCKHLASWAGMQFSRPAEVACRATTCRVAVATMHSSGWLSCIRQAADAMSRCVSTMFCRYTTGKA